MSTSSENLSQSISMNQLNSDVVTRQRQVSFTKNKAATKIDEKYTQQECHQRKTKMSWLVYCIFYLLGCGTLLPWNFFITANEYFKYKLQHEKQLQSQFQNYFSVASMAPNLLVMILNILFLHKLSRYIRICGSLIIMSIMFAVTSALVLIDTSAKSQEFFIITLCKIVVINACSSVLQGALFGMVVMFPSNYIQAVMAGQGLGGVFAVLASILSLIGQNNVKSSSFGYFSTATVVLVISLVAYVMLEKTDFVKMHMDTDRALLRADSFDKIKDNIKAADDTNAVVPTSNIFRVFQQIMPLSLSTFSVFFVTLAVFPSTTARVTSTSDTKNEWTEKYFVPVICFLLFNIGDYAGKTLSAYIQKPGHNGYWLPFLCVSRVLFIPLFVFCNIQPRLNDSAVIFNHDVYPILFMLVFAVTNGYFASLSVIYAPRRVQPKDAELAGTIMAFSIVAGLAAGAGASFLVAPYI